MQQPSPQPNVAESIVTPSFSAKFWLLLILTGLGAGLAGGIAVVDAGSGKLIGVLAREALIACEGERE